MRPRISASQEPGPSPVFSTESVPVIADGRIDIEGSPPETTLTNSGIVVFTLPRAEFRYSFASGKAARGPEIPTILARISPVLPSVPSIADERISTSLDRHARSQARPRSEENTLHAKIQP